MSYRRKPPSPGRVSEPAQVYLHRPDQDRLARLTARLCTTKSDVLRRGLEALERQLTDPADHPALRVIGLGDSGMREALAADAVLARGEIESWEDSTDPDGT